MKACYKRQWQGGRALLGLAIALLILVLPGNPGGAQAEPPASPFPLGGNGPNPFSLPVPQLAPPEVKAIFEERAEEADLATIYLDGRPLFEVAAPTDGGTLSALERAQEIEERLERFAANWAGQELAVAPEVTYEIDAQSNQPVIYVDGEALMTVTYLDARLNGANSLTVRAEQIVSELEDALRKYRWERQPAYLWRQLRWLAAVLLITLLGSFAIAHTIQDLEKRRQVLRTTQTSASSGVNGETTPGQSTVHSMRHTLLTQQRISNLGILKQVLRLCQIVLWVGSVLLGLGFFPYTRWLQPLIINLLRLPVRFVLIGLLAYGLIRLSSLWIDRLFLAFQTRTAETLERSQRLVLRLSTFSQVIKGIVAFTIASIAFMVELSLLGVRVGPLLAGAGLLGFAVSFASQSLIKDIINGFLVLLEDQYGVGDVITVRGMSGFVETMNLRITQLRATDGQLITIPNGQIDIVQNLSKEWSRVDLMISVGLTADINQALQLVEEVAHTMQRDSIWGGLILEPPLLLGVDKLDHIGATIRIWIKTLPLKQWDVAREYRRRLKIAFEAAHIPIGVPQQVIHVDGGALPPPSAPGSPHHTAGQGPANASHSPSLSTPP